MNLVATTEDKMLSEALTSLKQVRLRLQCELAQRPEYRALLIINRATAQLTEESELAALLALRHSGFAEPEETWPEDAPTEPTSADPEYEPGDNAGAPATSPTDFANSMGDLASASPEFSELHVDDTPANPPAPTEKSAKDSSRAIDLFLSTTAQAATPVAAPARPRSFLPFVAPAHPVKTIGRS
jgi:hypothetical protein